MLNFVVLKYRFIEIIRKFPGYILLLVALNIAASQLVFADKLAQQLKFRHISKDDGLSQNTVTAISQDKAGFIWLGTQSSLQKYDGYRFQNYQHDHDNPFSISSGVITAISFDENDNPWLGIFPDKINFYDRDKNKFFPFTIPHQTARGFIQKLLHINNKLWIGHDGGISIIDKTTHSIANITTLPAKNNFIVNLFKDKNKVWAISKKSIFYLDSETAQVIAIYPLQLEENDNIRQAVFQKDNIWFGTSYGGVWKFDLANKIFLKVLSLAVIFPESKPAIYAMTYFAGKLWLGTDKEGIISYDLNSHKIAVFQHRRDEKYSLANNHIISLFVDQSKLLWAGTSANGIDRTPLTHKDFFTFREQEPYKSTPFINDIRAMLYANESNIWMIANNGSLKRFNPATNTYTTFSIPLNENVVSRTYGISAILEDNQKNILYGSRAGFWKFDLSSEKFSRISMIDKNKVDGGAPLSFVKDKKNRIWIGSVAAGIGKLNESDNTVTWFPVPEKYRDKLSNFVLSLSSGEKNKIWVGTSKGLAMFDTVSHEYHPLDLSQGGDNSLIIRTLYHSADGTLWVGTLSGLYSIKKIRNKWQVAYPFKEIPSLRGNIYAILSDRNKKLWISTNNGITRVDPRTKEYQVFTTEQGLQGDEFNGNAAFASPDGRFWFAGLNGVDTFYPEAIRKSSFQAPVWITGYQIGTEYFRVDSPEKLTQLEIPADAKYFKLEFSSLDYTNPEKNAYQIRTSDDDNNWINLQNSTEILYSKLKSGNLNINIMGSNHDGVWNPDFKSILIKKLPPIWQTPFAYIIYLVIIAILFHLIFLFFRKKSEQQQLVLHKLNESKQQLDWALWGSGDAFWVWDIVSGIITRQGLEQILDYNIGEIVDNGDGLKNLMHPDDIQHSFGTAEHRILTNDQNILELEYRLKNKQGNWLWFLDRGKIVETDEFGKATKMAGTFRNITFQKKIQSSQKLSDLIIRNMAEMVLVVDVNFRIISANPSFCFSMGYQLHEIKGKDPAIFNSVQHPVNFYDNIRKHLMKFGQWQGEMYQSNRNNKNSLHWVELIAIKNDSNDIINIIMVATDITEQKKAEEELRKLANYDTLTSLPNRSLFQDRLKHALLQAERCQNKVALLFIDLDRFKHINDSLGHSLGDQVLKKVSNIISQNIRKDDTLSRLGGDEFTVILGNITEGISTYHVCEKILKAFTSPFIVENRQIAITPSIGISIYPDDATDAANLLKFADTAMYVAKAQGRNRFKFYAQEMNRNAIRRLELENHLRLALEKDEFFLVYQPIIGTDSGKINGVEVLLRWENPFIGSVSPIEFIPLAEEIGIIVTIGEWVLEKACQQAKTWHASGYQQLKIAVNLSPLQFKNYDLCAMVEIVLDKYDFPPHLLTLEITESLIMDNIGVTKTQLSKLRKLQVNFSIDDFGTGYSSLNYLKQFPLNTLKIDRTFITDITTDKDDANLTSAIIGLSHNLGLTVIAEGVETKAQLEFLKQAHCEEVQGFYLSKPLTVKDLEAFLISNSKI